MAIILRDLSIRESHIVQVTFSAYEIDFWGVTYTRAGNLRVPSPEAARYVMVRLYDTAQRLRPDLVSSNDLDAKAATRVADLISAHLSD